MPLAAGTRLGHYEIVELLGAGGMGEVYRARDPRLNREVAIKVSAAQFSERFDREARAVAALNHPNICTLYDVGPNYLVMELIEGESPKGPLPIERALDYARQIADALEAAHDKGIVHRDLKPANIKIRPDGTVKVLDFGLAKVTPATVAPASAGDPENSPTLSMAATQAGVILGTAAYMSPEQARGEPVDKRADIWAFGVVLYEMLVGRRIFEGKTVSDVLAAVLIKEPDLDRVPAQVRPVLRRCLVKDAKQRLHHAADVRLLLLETPEPVAQAISSPAKSSRLGIFVTSAAAILFLLAAAALAFIHFRETTPPAEVMRFQIQPPEKSSFSLSPRVSPDGRRIAFTAPGPDGRLFVWVRALDSLDPRPLAATEEGNGNIFWSFDSRFIVFPVDGKLKKIEASGGPAQTVCDLTGLLRGGDWNRDDVIVFGNSLGLWKVPAGGGAATRLAALDASRQEILHGGPVFLPDQRHFLYLRRSSVAENTGIYLGSLDFKPEEQASKRLLTAEGNPIYAPAADPNRGHILFLREGTLMAQAFDNGKLELAGDAVLIAENIGNTASQGYFSASKTGVLAFRTGGQGGTREYTWFDRQGKKLSVALEPGSYGSLTLSPDATRVAGERTNTNPDIWLLEFAGGVSTQFTFDPGTEAEPVWSPDGSHIVFRSNRDGIMNLYQKVSSGAGTDEILYKSPELKYPKDWSLDGKFLLYAAAEPKPGGLMALPMTGDPGDRKPIPAVQDAAAEQGQFSPDSHWVVYRSLAGGGRSEIYVAPFPPTGAKWKVSTDGGSQARWRSSNEILYLGIEGKMMAVKVSTNGSTFQFQTPQFLFDAQIFGGVLSGAFRWDVTADGKRFLMITPVTEAASPPTTVVLNWPALLKNGR